MMEKELYLNIGFYLTMKDGETKEEALQRFYKITDVLETVEDQESSFQVYEAKEQ